MGRKTSWANRILKPSVQPSNKQLTLSPHPTPVRCTADPPLSSFLLPPPFIRSKDSDALSLSLSSSPLSLHLRRSPNLLPNQPPRFPHPKSMNNHHQEGSTSRPRHGGGGGGGGGGREDCWSEGATETLIEAWGDRYLQLNRGNLRQKDWKEVADAVNTRSNGVKPRRTDVQCKNRVDTLKKKFKLEKAKPAPSKWPFYYRLDHLIGTTSTAAVTPSKKKTAAAAALYKPPTTTVTLTVKSRPKANPNSNPNPSPQVVVYSGGSSRLNSSGSNESSLGGEGRDEIGVGVRKHGRMDYVDLSEEGACKELARAILRFGEIYERIESSKQQQMMEMEKQRMEFTKDLEFQRMNMFMEAQLKIEKMKRPPKYAPSSGKKL